MWGLIARPGLAPVLMAAGDGRPPAKRPPRRPHTPLPEKDPFDLWWPRVTKVVLFFAGLAGVGYEAVERGAERPSFLLLYGAMMGVTAFLPNGKS